MAHERPKCFYCGHDAIWGGDHMMDECGIEDVEGMVCNWGCANNDCAVSIIYYHLVDEIKEDKNG